jgi:hypothetical protein
MVGMLTALPGTALWRRLEREGRLRAEASGDQFDRPNFVPEMGDVALVAGYRRLLAALYSDEAYFRRCALHLELAPARAAPARSGGFAALGRAVWRIGLLGRRRRFFWRLLAQALRAGGLRAVPKAVTLAILGEHLVRYTQEEVLPRLDRLLDANRGDEAPEAAIGITRSRALPPPYRRAAAPAPLPCPPSRPVLEAVSSE